ncbi:hypothetical protein GCM10022421_19970 [Oceanisphaera sediminis]|uniref:Uncharacterized protein n=1 Tax=Oceanisphaera sediminis TaxID=981381 RepID=A0ABP7E0U3_9GAMM
MNLTIAAAAFCNWQQATPILQQLGTGSQPAATELATEATMQQLAELLARHGNGAVVLYAPLNMALEHAADMGIEPSQAMALWQLNTTQLIRFCKQQRGKTLLFNLADVLAAPQLFKTLCAQNWSDLTVKQAPAAAGVQPVATLYRLLGQCLLSSTPGLLALSQQLDALAQPLSSAPTTAPTASELNQLVADHHAGSLAQQQLKEANQQNQCFSEQVSTLIKEKEAALQSASARAELEQENTLLLEQLHQVQEALESNSLKHNAQKVEQEKTLIQAREQLNQAQITHKKQLEALTQEKAAALQSASARAELEQESALLLEQLHRVQEALESSLLEHNAQKAKQEKTLGQAREQLNQAQTTHKEQLATLRQQLEALTQEKAAALQSVKAYAELKQENTLLLEQLFVVQEELEKHLTASQPQAEQHTSMAVSAQTDANEGVKPAKQPSALNRQLKKRAEKKRLKRKAAELAGSPLFNTEWYLKEYPDVAADKTFSQDPALHYLTCGGFEGRNPSPHFNSQDYLNANPDVATAGFNPLYHYLRFGEAENRPRY